MAFTIDDFNKIWASTSPLTPYSFSESNYKEGWNFIGGTPPARQMWDSIQKSNDEKTNWLYNAHNDLLDLLKTLIPTGCVQAFAGATIPTGWLLCDGSAISRTDYADLFAVIGSTYGDGDGSTTFNLPDLVDKFVQGSATAGTELSAGLPNITGDFGSSIPRTASPSTSALAFYSNTTGAFARGSSPTTDTVKYFNPAGDVTGDVYSRMTIDASRSSAIYGNSNTVQPPALTMCYIIKY